MLKQSFSLRGFIGQLRFLLLPDDAYLRQKIEDHRFVFVALNVGSALIGTALWLWDRAIDPIGYQDTLLLRLVHLLLIFNALAVWTRKPLRMIEVTALVTCLCCVGTYVLILARLHNGYVMGLGGFMYFMLLPVALLQGLSGLFVVLITFGAALLPHVMAWLGFAPGFSHFYYGIVIWPAFGMAILALVSFEFNYLKRFRSERALEFDTKHDPLTGAWNRRVFEPMLHQHFSLARRQKLPLTVLMLDIDFFKRVNDTYGHPTGDRVICQLAEVCNTVAIRASDVVARLGGEEFAVLLPNTNLANATQMAERIRETFARTTIFSNSGETLQVTVSIGLASAQDIDRTEGDLLTRADKALYQAKTSGRNHVAVASGLEQLQP